MQANGRSKMVPRSRRPAAEIEGREVEEIIERLELGKAVERLKLFRKKRDETQDVNFKHDLTYYAIPDMELRVMELKGGLRRVEKPAPAGKQNLVLHTPSSRRTINPVKAPSRR